MLLKFSIICFFSSYEHSKVLGFRGAGCRKGYEPMLQLLQHLLSQFCVENVQISKLYTIPESS